MSEADDASTILDARQAGYDDFNEFCVPDDLCPFELPDLQEAYREGWMEAYFHMGQDNE